MKDLLKHVEVLKEMRDETTLKDNLIAGRLPTDEEISTRTPEEKEALDYFISLAESIENVKGEKLDIIGKLKNLYATGHIDGQKLEKPLSFDDAYKTEVAIQKAYKLALAKMMSKEKIMELLSSRIYHKSCGLLNEREKLLISMDADAIRKEVGVG